MKKTIAVLFFVCLLLLPCMNLFASDMPDWVLDEESFENLDDGYVYAVGYGKGKTQQSSMLIAEEMAKANLNQMVKAMVTSLTQFYIEDSGLADSDAPDAAQARYSLRVVSETFSRNELKGIKRKTWYKDDEGYVYVLMRMPESNILDAYDTAVQSSVDTYTGANLNGNAMVSSNLRDKAISDLRERVKEESPYEYKNNSGEN